MGSTRLDIDLAFSLVEPGSPGDTTAPEILTGTITAAGTDVAITVSNPALVAGRRQFSLESLRQLAAEIAALGIAVSLEGPDGLVGRVGAVESTALQRTVTGSPHIQFAPVGVLATLLAARKQESGGRIPLPPTTPFPFAPTFGRRAHRKPTTTHHTRGAGRPRLIFVVGSENWDGEPAREFDLLPGTTTIGSSPDADLRLEGLDPIHVQITHDADDEYCLVITGRGEAGSAKAFSPSGLKLRTGARIEIGQWKMAYFREEFADHGRPFGGRQGGEGEHQRRQSGRHDFDQPQ